MTKSTSIGLLLLSWCLAALPFPASAEAPASSATAPKASEPLITREQIESDWLRQEVVRRLPTVSNERAVRRTLTTQQDAAGAVDGIKDGSYGFHTERDASPWWQVDLGVPTTLARIRIYNRCDGNVESRAAHLQVLLSQDGKTWTRRYQHDGSPFRGQADGKPLVVPLDNATARFVRLQLPGPQYFHLDEVEICARGRDDNIALGCPANQSSVSKWSNLSPEPVPAVDLTRAPERPIYPVEQVLERGFKLAHSCRQLGADVQATVDTLNQVAVAIESLPENIMAKARRGHYLSARRAVRRLALSNPLLDFDDLLFVKRVPGSFTHMSDQYYGWWSRPGGGLYVLRDFKTDRARLECLTADLPPGSVLRPDVSYDGTKVLFAYCRHYPKLKDEPNKLDKANVPEDAFYHLYEMSLGGTGLRRLTRGKYDDFDGRYLPNGEIVFLSTRRGQAIQCDRQFAQQSVTGEMPDCYVRCGGGPSRPVAVYTLHVMRADGGDLRQISPFEMFEWTPSVADDGRVLYARWDYVDRHNMPYMSLWSTMPDGTGARAVFGNYTTDPHCIFEARAIPGSHKIIFTASGHHALTGGSLVLLDPNKAADGEAAMTRLTPEVAFPEAEGWPQTYFANPFPLSETHYFVAWSAAPLPPGTPRPAWGMPGPPNDLGLYLFDAFGNLELIYRDPQINSMCPLPIRRRAPEPTPSTVVDRDGQQEGRMLVLDIYRGLESIPRGTVRQLRLVGVPVKTHPTMNYPSIGLTRDDPGKFVIGTVPVESDGSAHFRVPAGVAFFLQALDAEGRTIQTMRSATYLQAGQSATCVGCHEPRNTSPPNRSSLAMLRAPSRITPGPDGSWPLSFDVLVGPVLTRQCVRCHQPGTEGARPDLTAGKAYESLVAYGKPSLRDHVKARYAQGRSIAGACAATVSPLVKLLKDDHYDVRLNKDDWSRLYAWMDTYGQQQGSFGPQQDERLRELRRRMQGMLAARP